MYQKGFYAAIVFVGEQLITNVSTEAGQVWKYYLDFHEASKNISRKLNRKKSMVPYS